MNSCKQTLYFSNYLLIITLVLTGLHYCSSSCGLANHYPWEFDFGYHVLNGTRHCIQISHYANNGAPLKYCHGSCRSTFKTRGYGRMDNYPNPTSREVNGSCNVNASCCLVGNSVPISFTVYYICRPTSEVIDDFHDFLYGYIYYGAIYRYSTSFITRMFIDGLGGIGSPYVHVISVTRNSAVSCKCTNCYRSEPSSWEQECERLLPQN